MQSAAVKQMRTTFTEVKNIPPISVLVHCRVVVEKRDFVSTGILSMAEGDLLEVEIGDYQRFELGENVKLTVYTPVGMFQIQTSIIARDTGRLMLINPPDNQRKFSEKRDFPRIELSGTGFVRSINPKNSSNSKVARILPEPLPLQVRDISQNGLGFSVQLGNERLDVETRADLMLDLGFPLFCTVEVIRKDGSVEGQGFFGARFTQVDEERLNSLKAFILRSQIQFHVERRNEAKRTFR